MRRPGAYDNLKTPCLADGTVHGNKYFNIRLGGAQPIPVDLQVQLC